jgi:membrane-bound metal-dependent hydrolase YbcI (DUF457 family)
MLPVAHGLLGATIVASFQSSTTERRNSKDLLLGALMGIAPDFDYALNYVPALGRGWHHGFTHSLVFGCLVGLLVSLCKRFSWKSAMVYSLAILSHPLLDYFFTESNGIELLWPFSSHRFRLQVPNPIDYTWSTASVSDAAFDLLRISLIELMIFAPLFLIVLWIRNSRSIAPGQQDKLRNNF